MTDITEKKAEILKLMFSTWDSFDDDRYEFHADDERTDEQIEEDDINYEKWNDGDIESYIKHPLSEDDRCTDEIQIKRLDGLSDNVIDMLYCLTSLIKANKILMMDKDVMLGWHASGFYINCKSDIIIYHER